jgi:hypothetical protein
MFQFSKKLFNCSLVKVSKLLQKGKVQYKGETIIINDTGNKINVTLKEKAKNIEFSIVKVENFMGTPLETVFSDDSKLQKNLRIANNKLNVESLGDSSKDYYYHSFDDMEGTGNGI